MITDFFKLGIGNLRKQKLRSWLTMLGIFIGIASVVALVSLGQGLEKAINEQFEEVGADKIIIQSKGIFGAHTTEIKPLTDEDLDVVEKTKGVLDGGGYILKTAKIGVDGVIRYFNAFGLVPEDKLTEEIFNLDIEHGRNLKKGEKSKVVLGHDFLNEDLFGRSLKLRETILINDREFKIVGFYETFGNKIDDQSVYLSYDTMEEIYEFNNVYTAIFAKVNANLDPEIVAKDVEEELRDKHDVKEGSEDFTVQTAKELFESFSNIISILQIFLIGIAAISLVVGGIGIMNTMYTSVLERTKEIGVMKSIGATNRDIMIIFLIESGILGLIGGLIGVIIGMGFSKFVEVIAANVGYSIIKISFPPALILGTLIFAFIIGSLSGLVPAYKASKLQPVDALRYE